MKKLLNISSIVILILSLSSFAKADYLKLNYGLTSNDSAVKLNGTGATIDDDDEGFMISAGTKLYGNFGLEVMYYDLGETSIKGSVGDKIKVDNAGYVFTTAGTVKNETTGYGVGIFAESETTTGLGTFSGFVKLGMHNWDRSGSTTLIEEASKSFASRFYNDGIDMYFGIGINAGITESIALNISYDNMGFSDDGSLDSAGSLTSIGITANF